MKGFAKLEMLAYKQTWRKENTAGYVKEVSGFQEF